MKFRVLIPVLALALAASAAPLHGQAASKGPGPLKIQKLTDSVWAAEPGKGANVGWFLLGDIPAVDGVEAKTDIVHLDGADNLDHGWSVRTDGEIYAIARAGRRLYLGGSFSKVGGTPRAGLRRWTHAPGSSSTGTRVSRGGPRTTPPRCTCSPRPPAGA